MSHYIRPMPGRVPHTIIKSATFTAASATGDLPPPTGVEVAFAGRSNVGKSSLLNALTERKSLARTSSTPGCTRVIAMFDIETGDGARLTLVDLPGYGYAKRSKSERAQWGAAIEDYLLGRPSLAAVVLLVDSRRGLEEEEQQLLELLASPPKVSRRPLGVVLIATKLDKMGLAQRKPSMQALQKRAGKPVIGFSTEDRSLRDEVWLAVRRAAGIPPAAEIG